ncbi:MAG: hypothetical protein WAT79_03755 [Saprospiraceae bacterium]
MAGVVTRIVLLWYFPLLSDDIYRYYFDGTMILEGKNPYGLLPTDVFQHNETRLPLTILERMNSPNYFTVYPPLAQGLFALAALGDNVEQFAMNLKLILLLLECGGLYFIVILSQRFLGNTSASIWYFLNPLVIIEGVGNLHFEVLIVAFMAPMVYFFLEKKYIKSSFYYVLAIAAKLLPLILLPLLFLKLPKEKRFIFLAVLVFGLTLFFLPFVFQPGFFTLFESIDLYFQKFEFNASIYVILREIGLFLSGYNLIYYLGPFLGLLTIFGIFKVLKFYQHIGFNLVFKPMVLMYSLYFILSTTIHPWYIIPILFFGSFTGFVYPVVWSYVVVLSYVHYSDFSPLIKQSMYIVEYVLLFGTMYWDWKSQKLLQI